MKSGVVSEERSRRFKREEKVNKYELRKIFAIFFEKIFKISKSGGRRIGRISLRPADLWRKSFLQQIFPEKQRERAREKGIGEKTRGGETLGRSDRLGSSSAI